MIAQGGDLLFDDINLVKYLEQRLSQAIDPNELKQARETAASFRVPLPQALLDKSLITEEILGRTIGEYFGLPYVALKGKSIDPKILELIPEDSARRLNAIAFDIKDNELWVALVDPKDVEAIDFIEKKTGKNVRTFFTLESDLKEGLRLYKISLKAEFKEIIETNAQKTGSYSHDLEQSAKDVPVIKALDTILDYAIVEKASDIHIESIEENVIIRFRIDGILHDMVTLPKELQQALVARIKILSNLKIDEHRLPQDGRFKFGKGDIAIALRVSIIPTYYGENIVLRLLSESERPKTLEELGFYGRNLKVILDNIKKPNGMVLVTGPTGSGKTTTLYSVLSMLNSPESKICTVEDPIEYGFRRISQIQVNTKTGLTFAEGLRALLRHDPNIIMVGEIRDKETARISVQAALTGHLVLSTLHTNDASSAIPRFIDLGVEGFLVASTVNVVIAQRLVRKICRSCMQKYQPRPELIEKITKNIGAGRYDFHNKTFYFGAGCDSCHKTGYQGRIGVYETFEMDDELSELTIKQVPVTDLRTAALKKGMTTMFEDGLIKAEAGLTTLEEVLRVAEE